jgi:hypothetical protein
MKDPVKSVKKEDKTYHKVNKISIGKKYFSLKW